ncbi:Uncharacterised protein [Corynebacterium renale]|nr:Uncharacterised protein [Corynebacterium renale]
MCRLRIVLVRWRVSLVTLKWVGLLMKLWLLRGLIVNLEAEYE